MIYIGTDVVEVGRIEDLMRRWSQRFLDRIYTAQEKAYCERQAVPAIHYAGRFAAKEAARKALHAAGQQSTVPFKDIDINRDHLGVPSITLGRDARGTPSPYRMALSISHTGQIAIATVALESDG